VEYASETAHELLIFLKFEGAFRRDPLQLARPVGMIRIVGEVAIGSIWCASFFVRINDHGVIDMQRGKIGEKGNEKVAAPESTLEFLVRLFLITFAVQIEHSAIAGPQISRPPEPDIPLH